MNALALFWRLFRWLSAKPDPGRVITHIFSFLLIREEQGQERSEGSRSSWRAFLRKIQAKWSFSNWIKVREFLSDNGVSVELEVSIPGAQPF